jgi:hypothetical protein
MGSATTNLGDDGKWRDEYSEVLRGVQVVILPDDGDLGSQHAKMIALLGIGEPIADSRLSALSLPTNNEMEVYRKCFFSSGHL